MPSQSQEMACHAKIIGCSRRGLKLLCNNQKNLEEARSHLMLPPGQQLAWTDCKFWEDMRSATPVVKLFPIGREPWEARPGTHDWLAFPDRWPTMHTSGVNLQRNLCRTVLALGRQTAGRNVPVNP